MSKRNKPRKDPTQSQPPQHTANNKDNPANWEVPTLTEIPPTPNNKKQSEKRGYKSMEWWKALLEVIGIPFAIGYAVVTFLQWRDLHHNFVTEERAWVVPKQNGVSTSVNNGGKLEGFVTMINTGKTPAQRLSYGFSIDIVPNGGTPNFGDLRYYVAGDINILYPNEPRQVFMARGHFKSVNDHEVGEPYPITKEEVDALDFGKAYTAIYGMISYDDIFHIHHWRRYCAWIHGEKAPLTAFDTRGCTDYNAED